MSTNINNSKPKQCSDDGSGGVDPDDIVVDLDLYKTYNTQNFVM